MDKYEHTKLTMLKKGNNHSQKSNAKWEKIFSIHINSLPNIKRASFQISFKRKSSNPTKKDINSSQKKEMQKALKYTKRLPSHPYKGNTKATLLHNFLHTVSSQPKAGLLLPAIS